MSEFLEERACQEHFDCHRGIFRIWGPLPGMAFQPTMTYEPLGGRLWTMSEGVYRTVFLEGDRGLVAFDTFYSPGAALAYRNALGRLFPRKEIHTVVYSHDHLDHAGYGLNLAPGAEVIAHAEAAEVIAARASDGQAPPTQTWDGGGYELEVDGVSCELFNPGPTHGNGNVAVLFREQRTLFMVDTVIPGVGYTFYPDWHLTRYRANVRKLLELDWDVFVPGHFWALDRRGFEDNLRWLDVLDEAAQEAIADGVDPDSLDEVDAYARARLGPEHGHLFRFYEYAGTNLMRVMQHYLTGGWGPEDNL